MARLVIKNMVCPRCILSVESILREQDLRFTSIRLGEVELAGAPLPGELERLAAALAQVGFELLDDRRRQLIEKVKNLLVEKIQSGAIEDHFSISRYLSAALFKDYSQISKLFSEVEGVTIEQYFILQKIEKAKEWLVYDQLSVADIALQLGYSSTQHFSGQFKKTTGMTPGAFRKIGAGLRRGLDAL
ncbi:MAG TPA: AraC family transcriptional regulator [Chitinophagaceae bacterium]|jgi:AraC-like DNA-binding protein|nr:AraC family transcriptional regulator [Chitinophagaceae bacterium]